MIVDRYDRPVSYLRLSLTDKCNLRCQYCMPPEGMQWLPSESLLQDDEIVQLLQEVYVPLGVRQIRLTGGEPMLRRGLIGLVGRIARIPGIEDLAMSTNGIFLPGNAKALAEAGLTRLNVSLDSLQPERFAAITRGGDLQRVLQGIDEAIAAGITPVKLNMVVIPGENEDDVLAMAELTLHKPVNVRFIELMHVGDQAFANARGYYPIARMIEQIGGHHTLIAPLQPVKGNGPAKQLQIAGAQGTLGFISPMSENFCHNCNRTRLTADGQIKACLMRPQEMDLLGALRRGESTERLQAMVLESVGFKPQHHEFGADLPITRTMSRIGG